jgi:hypothetical protein
VNGHRFGREGLQAMVEGERAVWQSPAKAGGGGSERGEEEGQGGRR